MALKLKMDGEHAVLQDGKPVYVNDDGIEAAIDVAGTVATISRLNGEAKANRERAEAAEKVAKAFEGLDAAAARKAMDITANLDAKKLIDAGEVEKVRTEINSAWQTKYDAEVSARAALEGAFYSEKIGGAFARSKFIAEKIAVPGDMVQATFGSRFKIEDGQVAAYDQNGQRIYSRAKPGEAADFEEALAIMVDGYPHKDSILKGANNGGGGTRQSQGGTGGKTMTRAQFDAMAKADPLAARNAVTVDKITVVD